MISTSLSVKSASLEEEEEEEEEENVLIFSIGDAGLPVWSNVL